MNSKSSADTANFGQIRNFFFLEKGLDSLLNVWQTYYKFTTPGTISNKHRSTFSQIMLIDQPLLSLATGTFKCTYHFYATCSEINNKTNLKLKELLKIFLFLCMPLPFCLNNLTNWLVVVWGHLWHILVSRLKVQFFSVFEVVLW